MKNYIDVEQIKVAQCLHAFVTTEVLPGCELEPTLFWSGFADLLEDLAPRNRELLAVRAIMQEKIDAWHSQHCDTSIDHAEYQVFLKKIGYIVEPPTDFKIGTKNVDVEIASMPGPQLVVPLSNARFALNAANARWGSLYDALYGTDAISEGNGAGRSGSYNAVRGAKVIARGREFLDQAFPLREGSHTDAIEYTVADHRLKVVLHGDLLAELLDAKKFVGYSGAAQNPASIVLKNNDIHAIISLDKAHTIGATDKAGVADIILESALTTIMDAEDSIAAVDAEDKTALYRNWLGLMKGDLVDSFQKNGQRVERKLVGDLEFLDGAGRQQRLSGRSLMFIRNVGHLMTNNAVLLANGSEAPEGLLDAVISVLIAKHDLLGHGWWKNSRTDSVYIVKPKMHGPKEVAFAVDTFARVEKLLGLPEDTVKIGIMDEERRTTVNLRACIHAARDRVVFINTGFLDRTGDEIHTSMRAGPMVRKDEMKNTAWIGAYEDANVDAGLASGFPGKAQIGKGMWAMPDLMADMLREKIAHPLSGANTAWTPSPTAATLHALHYHAINVKRRQAELSERPPARLQDILQIPLAANPSWTEGEVHNELENNAQGILGYVVRWVEQGIGCSKVPDINNVGLMEDRATLRISSQHIANWLANDVCTHTQVMDALHKMAVKVDEQNSADPHYVNMAPDYDDSIAFQAACDLVFKGATQPNGYTEPVLHRRRLQFKQSNHPRYS